MKKRLIIFLSIFFIIASCSKVEKVKGKWKVIYISPVKKPKTSDYQAFTLLNLLSNNSTLVFNNDSLYLNKKFLGHYKLKGDSIYFRKEHNYHKIYKYNFSHDTLILKNSTLNIKIKLLNK